MDGKPYDPAKGLSNRIFAGRAGTVSEERGSGDRYFIWRRCGGWTERLQKNRTAYWLERMGVAEYAAKKLETLSKGNQQKVQLAQTLVCQPDIIILDEPFSGLDPVNSQVLKDVNP